MVELRRPDFLYVGHPRSGSGRLEGYLTGHPDVFMARKELHYFGSDLEYNDPPRSLSNYQAHFRGGGSYRRVGEASTWLLVSRTAAAEIKAYAPDACVLIMLRNPVDWLYSLHSHMLYAAYEDIPDFGEALAALHERRRGRRMPRWPSPPIGVLYADLVRYHDQVERYLDVFGEDRTMVLLFDDFRDAPDRTFDQVLDFLELPRSFPGRDVVIQGTRKSTNANSQPRSRRVQDWIKHPKRRAIYRSLVPLPFPNAHRALRALYLLNTRRVPRSPMDPTLRARLAEQFTPEVERLEGLLGRDLSSWRQNP